MKQKSKLLKKICAWMLAIATIATTLIPSSGAVFADDDTVKEPVLQSESETPYGKILLKVPKKGGFIQFSNNDGIVQQLYVEEGKTYIKNMSTNEATEVIIPEKQDFTYEFVAELGTITTFETTVSEGYEVSTYKITTDSGEEVKSETDKTALSSTYKEEIEVKEETQVLEVVFDEVEEKSNTTETDEDAIKSKVTEENVSENNSLPEKTIISDDNVNNENRTNFFGLNNYTAETYPTEPATTTIGTIGKEVGKAYVSKNGLFPRSTGNANISYDTTIKYFGWSTTMFRVQTNTGTHLGVCGNPTKDSTSGTFGISEWNDDRIKLVLMTMPFGPESQPNDWWHTDVIVEDDYVRYGIGHAVVSFYYTGATTGFVDEGYGSPYDTVFRGIPNNITTMLNGGAWNSKLAEYKLYVAKSGNNMQDILWIEHEPKGKLAIQKTSANSNWTSGNAYYSLAGAHYGIWKNAACTEGTGTSITTDATGKGISGDLNAGDYYVKEITAPKGYKLDTNVYKVSVAAGDNNPTPSTLNDSNRHKEFPKPGNVYLEKVSSKPDATKDNPNYSLAGAEYSVYRDEACTDFATKMVTDANGKAKTGDLALGKYWIKETKPSPGHTLDIDPNTKKARVYSCELSDVPGKSTSYTVKSTDPVKLDPVPLLLRKVDAESGGAAVGSGSLEGAEFEVKFYWKQMDKDPATEGYTLLRQWRLKTTPSLKGDGAYLQLTNNNLVSGDKFWYDDYGNVSFPYGTITFKEVKSPNGYLLDTKTHVVQVTGDPVDVNGNISFHTPVQKEVSLKLNLTKKQFGTDKVIPGAKFLHTKPDGSTEELTTDANGALSFKGLQWGNHKVVETYVPDGYSINTNPITFKVETNNQVTNISTAKESDTNGNITIKVENDGNISATVFDKPAPFDLAIHKVNNHDFALAGAEFTLYSDASCKTVVDKQISDTNGNLTMKKLIPEKVYYLKETKAPKGYRIPVNADGSDIVWKISVKSVPVDNKFEFYVNDKAYTTGTGQFHISGTKADRITNMTIVNEVGMKLPETGSSMMIIIIIAGLGLMAGALVISRRGKVKKTEGSEEK